MTRRAIFALGIMACVPSKTARTQGAQRLPAPSYYVSVFAQREYGDTVRVKGASNLPPGAAVALEVIATNGDGWTEYSKAVCVATSKEGVFNQEMNISSELPHRTDLFVRATFLTNACKQSAHVLQVVGHHGELLGNDGRPITMEEVERGETPGMQKNPELFQVSGWFFGISAIARVD
jgi:hypothetical protein